MTGREGGRLEEYDEMVLTPGMCGAKWLEQVRALLDPLRFQLVPTVEKGIKGRMSLVKRKSHSNVALHKKKP